MSSCDIGYMMFIPEVIQDHYRSSKCTLLEVKCGIYYLYYSQTITFLEVNWYAEVICEEKIYYNWWCCPWRPVEVTRGQFWIKIAFFRQTKGKKLRKLFLLFFLNAVQIWKPFSNASRKYSKIYLVFQLFSMQMIPKLGSVSVILTPMNDAIKEINSKLSPGVAELYKLTEILLDTSEFF